MFVSYVGADLLISYFSYDINVSFPFKIPSFRFSLFFFSFFL